MPMSPRAEDFERLALRWAQEPRNTEHYADLISAISSFPELYATDRDRLPQTDADRAFGLMARACEILDDEAPFATSDQEAAQMAGHAAELLMEAIKLDPYCYDAIRIQQSLQGVERDALVDFLRAHADEVFAYCVQTSQQNLIPVVHGRYSASVYMRPYLRWMHALANEELNCARYRRSAEVCRELRDIDGPDLVGARLVEALVCVKLEDADALADLIAAFPGDRNAWFDLARTFMAFDQFRMQDAAALLHAVVRNYPSAGEILTQQEEVPQGAFCRLTYEPGSSDELYVALSEASVVLAESSGDSSLAAWIAADPLVVQARESEAAQREYYADEQIRRTQEGAARRDSGAAPSTGRLRPDHRPATASPAPDAAASGTALDASAPDKASSLDGPAFGTGAPATGDAPSADDPATDDVPSADDPATGDATSTDGSAPDDTSDTDDAFPNGQGKGGDAR